MYQKLLTLCTSHTHQQANKLKEQLSGDGRSVVHQSWTDHQRQMVFFAHSKMMIRNVLLFLDRTWILNSKSKCIWEMGQDLFRDFIVEDKMIKKLLVEKLLLEINKYRCAIITPEMDNWLLPLSLEKMLECYWIFLSMFLSSKVHFCKKLNRIIRLNLKIV